MDTLEYNPYDELQQLLRSPQQMSEVDEMLNHVHKYRNQISREVEADVASYDRQVPSAAIIDKVSAMIQAIADVKNEARQSEQTISSVTSSIQKLDAYKRNLVTSMTILKRLQMLINAHNTLMSIIPDRNYDEIHQLLSVIREFLVFFKPYKSISEINKINLMVQTTQNKLVNDLLLDFEEATTTSIPGGVDLRGGARILELVDAKHKDRILSQFYNMQLKDIKQIFNSQDEAGSLDNFGRRFIYFSTVLDNIDQRYPTLFPEEWRVGMELSKVFCHLSKQDLQRLLSHTNHSATILDNLTGTIEFEKQLNDRFQTTEFTQVLSQLFEQHLGIWVAEQDRMMSTKFNELLALPPLPQELSSAKTAAELAEVLQTNNVPNISNSSIDLFKQFNKVMAQILKLSNGPVLIDIAKLFIKKLLEFNTQFMLPMLPSADDVVDAIDLIKYVSMVMNTGDYLLGNLDDLWERLAKVIKPQFVDRLPSADAVRDVYYQTNNRSVQCLVSKVGQDLRPGWRQMVNQNWHLESASGTSGYVPDLIKAIIATNAELVLPLIIRDALARNYCDKVVESVVVGFGNHLAMVSPLPGVAIERLKNDVAEVKSSLGKLPLFSDPHYKGDGGSASKMYTKHVNLHFGYLERLLAVLEAPSVPVEEFVAKYTEEIGDKSVTNFIKLLSLKGVDHRKKYVDMFKNETAAMDSCRANPLLAAVETELRDESSPTPEVKSPRLLATQFGASIQNQSAKIGNLERNIRDLGETRVSKFNENFKKFFRKDD